MWQHSPHGFAWIDLNLLVAFDALMAERSVTRAGMRIGRTQLAMSAALARLRALLRDELLVRSPLGCSRRRVRWTWPTHSAERSPISSACSSSPRRSSPGPPPSATDLSIFKPLFFGVELPRAGLLPLGTDTPSTLWWRHERLHRRAMPQHREVRPEIRAEFDTLERQFHEEALGVRRAAASLKAEFVEWCWQTALLRTERWIERLERRPYAVAHEGYRAMWDRFNAEASLAF